MPIFFDRPSPSIAWPRPRGTTEATLAMANPAAAAQHQARGGDGAAGRPATERAQGTGSPRLQGAAPAPAPAQQPRAGGPGGNPLAERARWAAARRAGRGGRRRARARTRGVTVHAAVPRGGACSAAGRPAALSPPLAWSAAAPPPPGSPWRGFASSRTILGSPRIPRTRAQGSYVLTPVNWVT